MVADITKPIPVIIVACLLIWSYYAYVYELCVQTIKDKIKMIAYIMVITLLFLMVNWCFYTTVFTPLDDVPEIYSVPFWQITKDDIELDAMLQSIIRERGLRIYTRNESGGIRYCKKCKLIKPDRTHHCSTCGKCVLKMDHHCPWVNNCIGWSNYKFFFLFVFYGSLYCSFYCLSALEFVVTYFYNGVYTIRSAQYVAGRWIIENEQRNNEEQEEDNQEVNLPSFINKET